LIESTYVMEVRCKLKDLLIGAFNAANVRAQVVDPLRMLPGMTAVCLCKALLGIVFNVFNGHARIRCS